MLQLSTRSRYATRIMLNLATHDGKIPVTKDLIASEESISVDYVEQILMKLKSAGLVRSQRGPKGGFLLACNPATVTVAHVLSAMEGPVALSPCVDEGCSRASICLTQEVWHKASIALIEVFQSYTIAELALQATGSRSLSFEI